MATKELTHLGTYVVPMVNLLPPEIGERKAQQRGYVAMGATVVAALGAVAFLYLGQASRVGAAEDEVTAAKQQNSTLVAQRAKLAYVDEVYAEVDANEAMLTRAADKRIFWSRNLADVALAMPDTVWLESIDIAQVMDAATADAAGSVLPKYDMGTVTFVGRAYQHDDVAAWLDASAKIVGYGNVWYTKSEAVVPTAEERAKGDRSFVEFSMTADIAPNAIQRMRKSVTR
jgi:Tfp pilus assembly protein PilN